jgi:hypothetical protein
VLRGSLKPRISSLPPATSSAGADAAAYSASVGLVLDPWQALFLEGALAERGALWAAFEVAGVVARQNGKGGILEARELVGVELGERLIMHTAHELKTAEEAFLRMCNIIEASPDLDRKVKRVIRTNGKEAIHFRGGARIKYLARSGKSGRGLTGDLIIFDEAMFLEAAVMGAIIPTLTTAANPQIWYMASGGLPTSTQLAALRARALAGGDESLAYLEWSAPEGASLDDRAAWAAANPALGIRITERFLELERIALPEDEWAREVLCLFEDSGRKPVLDPDIWATLEDLTSKSGAEVAFGIDVPPDRRSASISVAGERADGNVHVELVPCCDFHGDQGGQCAGTAWVPKRAAELDKRWKPKGFLLDPAAPAGSLIVGLAKAKVEPVLVGGREMAQACGLLYDLVMAEDAADRRLRHIGQAELTAAVDGARKRNLADAWAWHRRDATVNISPLVSATLAVHGLEKQPKRRRKTGRAMAA